MTAVVRAAALAGVRARVLEVSASAEPASLPGLVQLGLPEAGTGRRAQRVWAAVTASGVPWPSSRVTVTVAPSGLPGREASADLAVAVAVLAAFGAVPGGAASDVMCFAGLGPDGRLLPEPGVLPAAAAARAAGCRAVVVAPENAAEAALVPGVTVIGAPDLAEVAGWLRGGPAPAVPQARDFPQGRGADIASVHGNATARLAAEVAAAGGHHLSLAGPPGSGKALLASRLAGLLPRLCPAEAREVAAVYSARGIFGCRLLRRGGALAAAPPFAAPSAEVTVAGMAGTPAGGSSPGQPGAASMAHRGVLFLDNAPDFRREVLDVLRQPLESGQVTLARGALVTRFPARFLLVISATWCPCGNYRSPAGVCCCTRAQRRAWLGRLSGPLTDRCAVKAVMTPPAASELITPGESTAVAAGRVLEARERAAKRLAGTPWQLNGEIPRDELLRGFTPAPAGWELLGRAADLGRVSERGAADALRVAWTLADLGGRDRPGYTDCQTALEFQTGETR